MSNWTTNKNYGRTASPRTSASDNIASSYSSSGSSPRTVAPDLYVLNPRYAGTPGSADSFVNPIYTPNVRRELPVSPLESGQLSYLQRAYEKAGMPKSGPPPYSPPPTIEPEVRLYCGDRDVLPRGYTAFGTRNKCMRKGVGVGMLMGDEEREEALARPPKPKQEGVKLYCGDGELPTGYTGYETRFGCMRRGVGVGLRLPDDKRKAFQNKPPKPLSSRDISSMAQRLRVNVSGLSRDDALTALISRIREL